MDEANLVLLAGWIAAVLRGATPLMFVTLGETLGQRVGVINLGVEGEMLAGACFGFAVAAQTGDPVLGLVQDLAAARDETVCILRRDARLLVFLARIHLNEKPRQRLSLFARFHQRQRELLAVERVEHIEKRQRIVELVGLQGSDQMKFGIGKACAKRRPFRRRFLHAVLAEDALPGLDQGQDRFFAKGLRHRDERHVLRIAPRLTRRLFDAAANIGKARRRAAGTGISRLACHSLSVNDGGKLVAAAVRDKRDGAP